MSLLAMTMLLALAADANTDDACRALVPPALAAQLADDFPGFRPPIVADNLAEDVAWDRGDGGDGCLGAAVADFDGDGRDDVLLGMTPRRAVDADGRAIAPTVVAALARGGGWELHDLGMTYSIARTRLFVEALPPDPSAGPEAQAGASGDAVEAVACPTPVAVLGQTEAWADGYCHDGGRWAYVELTH
jgi:hypothetical protein